MGCIQRMVFKYVFVYWDLSEEYVFGSWRDWMRMKVNKYSYKRDVRSEPWDDAINLETNMGYKLW